MCNVTNRTKKTSNTAKKDRNEKCRISYVQYNKKRRKPKIAFSAWL